MKQYIVTEEHIQAIETLLSCISGCTDKPLLMEAAYKAICAGLRGQEYNKREELPWVPPMHDWVYTYQGEILTAEQLERLKELRLKDALANANAAIANNDYKQP